MKKKARKRIQTTSFRLPDGLRGRIREAARRDRRSMSQWVIIALEKAVSDQGRGA